MGDVLTLIDKAQEKLDAEEAQKAAENLMKGQFTFEDFLDQLGQVQKLDSMGDLLKMLPSVPGGKNAMKEMADAIDEGELKRAEAMILSMTSAERREPGIISGSRRLRIANGSGVTTADVNSLLKDFESARKMMRTMMGGKRVPRRHAGNDEGAVGEAAEAIAERRTGTARWRHASGCGAWERTSARSIASWWPISAPRATAVHRGHRQVPPARGPEPDRDRPERAMHWLRVGAQPSDQVCNLHGEGGHLGPLRGRAPERRRPGPRAKMRRRAQALEEGVCQGRGRSRGGGGGSSSRRCVRRARRL